MPEPASGISSSRAPWRCSTRAGSTAAACRTSSTRPGCRRVPSTTTSRARRRWGSRWCAPTARTRRCLRGRGRRGRHPFRRRDTAAEDPRVLRGRHRAERQLRSPQGVPARQLRDRTRPPQRGDREGRDRRPRQLERGRRPALAQAQEAGELSKDADVDALARYLVDGYEGAATRAKLIGDRAPMDEFIRTTFDFLLS